MTQDFNRRTFLEFIGKAVFLTQPILNSAYSAILPNTDNTEFNTHSSLDNMGFTPLEAQLNDNLMFSPEISFYSLIQRKTALGNNHFFGDNNDYLAFFPIPNKSNEALLWVNHEYPEMDHLFEEFGVRNITKEMVGVMKQRVGGSFLKVKKNDEGQLQIIPNDPLNRRYDANTPIPLISQSAIQGKTFAIGTLANCAGGVTPWKTLLSCEENYDGFVGEVYFENGRREYNKESRYGWTKYESFIPEHYGWVVEINPISGKAKKLTALGRFAHEGALNVVAKDGRTVVYMGDDREDQFIYKFISHIKGSLDQGELFVANTDTGQWLSLSWEKSDLLKKHFQNQTDVLIQTRKAAALLGATPQDRPEGMAIHPQTGDIFISCTNNETKQRPYGKILKITETHSDYLSLTFKVSNFVVGGKQFNFASPDNLVFDSQGNLWCTTDTSGKDLNRDAYSGMGGNALYIIPTQGSKAGMPIRVGSAPAGGEFTGPTFIDSHTMLISLQHPGEHQKVKSQWQSQVLVLNLSKNSLRERNSRIFSPHKI